MAADRLFDSTLEGKRRRVLFALAVTTALVTMVSAVSTYLAAPSNVEVVLTMIVLSLVFVAFSLAILSGQFGGLLTDNQLFWEVVELER